MKRLVKKFKFIDKDNRNLQMTLKNSVPKFVRNEKLANISKQTSTKPNAISKRISDVSNVLLRRRKLLYKALSMT
jgi:hypothetical protein